MKINLKFQSTNISGKLLEFYVLIIIGLFPLYLFSIKVTNISLKVIMLFIISLFIFVTYLYAFSLGQAKLRKFQGLLDCFVIVFTIVNSISLVTKIFNGNYNLESNILYISLGILYFLISVGGTFYAYYIEIFLVSTVILNYVVLLYHLGVSIFSEPLKLLVGSHQNMASFLLLTNTISIIFYCKEKKRNKKYFYLMSSILGFFLLFINEEPISIFLQVLVFLALPLIYKPTAQFIKNKLQLFFVFFFMWSNMALVANYWKIVKKELHYDITHSIYIDLFLAVMGIVIFNYWDKLPQNKNFEVLILESVRNVFKRVLQFVLGFSGIILLAGDKIDKVPQTFGIPTMNEIIKKLQMSYSSRNGTYYDILLEYGFIWFVIFVLITGYVIQIHCKKYLKNEQTKILTVITILYIVQSLFYGQQIVTTPIYVLFVTFGIFEKKEGITDEKETI